jgi:hypothetical protein
MRRQGLSPAKQDSRLLKRGGNLVDLCRVAGLVMCHERQPAAQREPADHRVVRGAPFERHGIGRSGGIEKRRTARGQRHGGSRSGHRALRAERIRHVDALAAHLQLRQTFGGHRRRWFLVRRNRFPAANGDELRDGMLDAREMFENLSGRPAALGGPALAVSLVTDVSTAAASSARRSASSSARVSEFMGRSSLGWHASPQLVAQVADDVHRPRGVLLFAGHHHHETLTVRCHVVYRRFLITSVTRVH